MAISETVTGRSETARFGSRFKKEDDQLVRFASRLEMPVNSGFLFQFGFPSAPCEKSRYVPKYYDKDARAGRKNTLDTMALPSGDAHR